jgi:hypothetical protein
LENIIIKQNIRREKQADKKPLIVVSICAVVLLVLGSLSNVIGYQSAKSTIASDSPLFSMRTQRATNQQQKTIRYQYLGMGKGNRWQFPTMDNRTESLKKILDIISKMDDKTFARFTELCIRQTKQDNTRSDINSKDIIRTLILLRTKPEMIINSFTNSDNQCISALAVSTLCNWAPICVIIFIIATFSPILGLALKILIEVTWYIVTNPYMV